MFFSQVVQRCERSFHNTQSFDPFLTSKISLNGALSTSHPFTFSLSMVLLYMMCLQEQSLIVSKRVLLYVEHVFFPKVFPKWLFMVEEGSGERKLFIKKKKNPHNHHASDCNSKDTVLCFQQRNNYSHSLLCANV